MQINHQMRKAASLSDIGLVVMIVVLVGIGGWMVVRENMSASQPADLPDAFKYDISDLKKIDPALITYEERSQFEPKLDNMLSLAVFNDRIYVAGDSGLKIFNADGSLFQTIIDKKKVSSFWIRSPEQVYVAMGNQVFVYDHGGSQQAAWKPLDSQCNLRSITGNQEHVFIADAMNRLVYVCDHQGVIVKKIGNNDEHGLVVPGPHLDLHWDGRQQELVMLNPGRHRIDTYDTSWQLTRHFGKPSMRELDGFCGCCNPTTFSLLPGGGYVTAEKGLNRIKRYDKDGVLIDVVAGPKSFDKLTRMYDIDVDASGLIYVLDSARQQVRVFGPKT